MKKRALIYPAGTEIGLEMLRSLEHQTHFEVFGANDGHSFAGHLHAYQWSSGFGTKYGANDGHSFAGHLARVFALPPASDPDFLKCLNDFIEFHKIDFFLPAHDAAIEKTAHLPQYVGSPPETASVCRSKLETLEMFPNECAARTFDFPCFVKPEFGNGSICAGIAQDASDLKHFARMAKDRGMGNLVMQEILTGQEYTVDCFTDRHGVLRFCSARIRNDYGGGIAKHTRIIDLPAARTFAEKIAEKVAFRGAWFFQLKHSEDGELKLLEVAPRIAGSSGIQRLRGINLTILGLYDAMGLDVEVTEPLNITYTDRALETRTKTAFDFDAAYFDVDGTVLTADGKVVPEMAAIIARLYYLKIPIIALSRNDHSESKHPIFHFFTKGVWCIDGPKSAHIDHKRPLFVDDSFRERKDVSENTNAVCVSPAQAIAIWR